MRLSTRIGSNWIVALTILTLLSACKGSVDDKADIVGIWQLHSINVNGQEIGDGKGYLDFQKGGKVISRTGPGLYDEGKYEIDAAKAQIVMKQDTTSQAYTYTLSKDSLTMKSNENGLALLLRGHKVAKMPITPENDPLPEGMQ